MPTSARPDDSSRGASLLEGVVAIALTACALLLVASIAVPACRAVNDLRAELCAELERRAEAFR